MTPVLATHRAATARRTDAATLAGSNPLPPRI